MSELLIIHPRIHSIATCQNNLKWHHLKMCFSVRLSDHQLRPTDATQVETLICATSKALPLGKSGGNSVTLAVGLLNFGGFIENYSAWICEWIHFSAAYWHLFIVVVEQSSLILNRELHTGVWIRDTKTQKHSNVLAVVIPCGSVASFENDHSLQRWLRCMLQTRVCVCVCVYARFIY